jgi:excisionase family DNA binding protein
MSDRLIDVPGVAAYLDVSEKFVRRHALELGAVKVGSHLRFRRADIDHYLEVNRLDAKGVRSLRRAI